MKTFNNCNFDNCSINMNDLDSDTMTKKITASVDDDLIKNNSFFDVVVNGISYDVELIVSKGNKPQQHYICTDGTNRTVMEGEYVVEIAWADKGEKRFAYIPPVFKFENDGSKNGAFWFKRSFVEEHAKIAIGKTANFFNNIPEKGLLRKDFPNPLALFEKIFK